MDDQVGRDSLNPREGYPQIRIITPEEVLHYED